MISCLIILNAEISVAYPFKTSLIISARSAYVTSLNTAFVSRQIKLEHKMMNFLKFLIKSVFGYLIVAYIIREYELTVGQKSLGAVLSEGFEKFFDVIEKPSRRKSRSRREAREKNIKDNLNSQMVSFDALKGLWEQI